MFADLFTLFTPSTHPAEPDVPQTVEFDSPRPREPLAYPGHPTRPAKARHIFPAESISVEEPNPSEWH